MQEKNERTKALIKKRDEMAKSKLENQLKEREQFLVQQRMLQRERSSSAIRKPDQLTPMGDAAKPRGKTQNTTRAKKPPTP